MAATWHAAVRYSEMQHSSTVLLCSPVFSGLRSALMRALQSTPLTLDTEYNSVYDTALTHRATSGSILTLYLCMRCCAPTALIKPLITTPLQEPRLFQISNATGKLNVEEIENFDQSDLCADDVMLLDTHTTVYIWIGSGSNETERKEAMAVAQVHALVYHAYIYILYFLYSTLSLTSHILCYKQSVGWQ
jgi:Gelsolin repeat